MTEYGELAGRDGSSEPKKMPQGFINCLRCVHYYVTWKPATPRGCRLVGFESREMPSMLVFESTGRKCIGFKAK